MCLENVNGVNVWDGSRLPLPLNVVRLLKSQAFFSEGIRDQKRQEWELFLTALANMVYYRVGEKNKEEEKLTVHFSSYIKHEEYSSVTLHYIS